MAKKEVNVEEILMTKTFAEYLQAVRMDRNLTREQVANIEINDKVSYNRLEYIETKPDEAVITPLDVSTLSDVYEMPELKYKYCKHYCPIGWEFRDVETKDLSHIAVDTLTALHKMNNIQERLLEIFEDDKITPDEYADFKNIKRTLEKIATSADNLKLWLDDQEAKHKLPKDVL